MFLNFVSSFSSKSAAIALGEAIMYIKAFDVQNYLNSLPTLYFQTTLEHIKLYKDFYANAFCMLDKILVIDVLLHSTSMNKLELWMI